MALAKTCFEFVRDEISHSWDVQRGPLTCKASDVLLHRSGFCYAKSHLLAALLRANGIPAALGYQRLEIEEGVRRYCLHGLNAVFLDGIGWYRIDARGNKSGINAVFNPPVEQLAFKLQDAGEKDFPQLFAEPLNVVVDALEYHRDIHAFAANLPDLEQLPA